MGVYALIKNGVVENTVVWDGKNDLFNEDEIVNIDDVDAGIGWSYSDGEFSPPAEVEKTQEEYIEIAEAERAARIEAANDVMNSKQWSGKAALGRLSENELAIYNTWLDYLDALEAIDTSSAPDIEWPVTPSE